MKKLKKFTKIFLYVFLGAIVSLVLSCMIFYHATTNGLALNNSKLEETITSSNLEIYDINGHQIKSTINNHIEITKLSANTKNAFVCAEDKRFYKHNGVDIIRIGGAIVSNLKTKSFSQGASTISQQLIKNTHLSNEKTIKRKLKEIKLTKALEKQYTKNEILEMYLNNIYFGNGCYGIENAAKYYFGKSATTLTLAESALLASTINAPGIYDIENNTQKTLSRKNLILDLMLKYGKITKSEHENAKNEDIKLNITSTSQINNLVDEIIKEACKVTNKTETQIKNSKLKIYTEIDLNLHNKINSIIANNFKNIDSNPKIACIVIDNKTNKIISLNGSKQTLNSKKQPGSTIKPILVFAPAIEQNNISPATKILDEKIDISGYKPENADKQYHGFVSVRECIKNSYNIPAVKILQETGIEKSQAFAKKLGITFNKNDNHLATALGSLSDGVTLKQLADAYSAFANNGYFQQSSLIKKITFDNTTIYSSSNTKTKVMKDSTAYLITNMLTDTSTSGTAKRLKNFNFEIASKTGTVGNKNHNTQSFNIAYTSMHTIISFFGDTQMPTEINGATYPTILTKHILETIYKNHSPANFAIPNTVTKKQIDKTDYENNIITLTDKNENSLTEIFSKTNIPQITNNSISLSLEAFNFKNKKPILCFFTSPNCTYNIYRKQKNKEELISSLTDINETKIAKFEDKSAKNNQIYEYFVEICEKSTNKVFKTNTVKLKTFN